MFHKIALAFLIQKAYSVIIIAFVADIQYSDRFIGVADGFSGFF